MKKIALLFALAAFAATPAVAASKKKAAPKNPQQMTHEEAMEYNKRNLGLIVKGLPLVLPTWSLPIYFKMTEEADKPKQSKKKKR